jgi:signal recognition particle GTPase
MKNLDAAARLTLNTTHQLNTVLLYGKQGSGTTTIASHFSR